MDVPENIALAEALVKPTRLAVFRYLAEKSGSARVDEIAAELGVHANSVRGHLAEMKKAGLVRQEDAPSPRGRPYQLWRVSANAKPFGGAPSEYKNLSRWLAMVAAASGADSSETAERLGRDEGRRLAEESSLDGRGSKEAMSSVFGAMGFAPKTRRRNDVLHVTLGRCAFSHAAAACPDVVCSLHRGLILGLLEMSVPTASLRRVVRADPGKGGCKVEIVDPSPAVKKSSSA